MVEFDDAGEIDGHFILDQSIGNYGVEILPYKWHSFIALQKDSVLYELKNGPFVEGQAKHFPDWAPEEGSPEADEYVNSILGKLSITL